MWLRIGLVALALRCARADEIEVEIGAAGGAAAPEAGGAPPKAKEAKYTSALFELEHSFDEFGAAFAPRGLVEVRTATPPKTGGADAEGAAARVAPARAARVTAPAALSAADAAALSALAVADGYYRVRARAHAVVAVGHGERRERGRVGGRERGRRRHARRARGRDARGRALRVGAARLGGRRGADLDEAARRERRAKLVERVLELEERGRVLRLLRLGRRAARLGRRRPARRADLDLDLVGARAAQRERDEANPQPHLAHERRGLRSGFAAKALA